MPSDNRLSFSRIVCGSPPVRAAFALHRPTRLWWRLVLLLHGKPVSATLSPAQRVRRVADGFRFYAGLYRLLAFLFVLLALALSAAGGPSPYWAGASLLAGVYLWGVSGLGYAGARAYGAGEPQGATALLAFLVMIVAFLSLFVAAASIAAHGAAGTIDVLNLAAAGALFAFGVGSYMIEIVYLATERP